jgi:hypothetical protein
VSLEAFFESVDDFFNGMDEAVREGVYGAIIAVFMLVLVALPVPSDMKLLIGILSFVPLIALFYDMLAWSLFFTGGWYFGIFLINGIIEPLDLAFYIITPAAIWIVRGYFWYQENH